jgi:hypothetical protein
MSPHTIHGDGITHSLAAACSDTLKQLAERATPDAILGAVAHLPHDEAEKALYAALSALEGLKNFSDKTRSKLVTLANASPDTEGGAE